MLIQFTSTVGSSVLVSAAWKHRGHFFAAAAAAMRRILVENARRKSRVKRGGDWMRREFDLAEFSAAEDYGYLIALNNTLNSLSERQSRKAKPG